MSAPADAPDGRSAPGHHGLLLAARIGLCCALATIVLGLWSRIDYVPLWDARIYADCAVRAARQPPSFDGLRCADHHSQAYIGILALGQLARPGSTTLLVLTNGLLLLLGVAAFARVLRAVLPGPALAADRTWLVAAFAVHPVVASAAVQVNLDFGVLVFLLVATAAALERRPAWMAAAGVLACFSKESGALLYAALVAVHAAVNVARHPLPRRLVPALLLAAVVLCLPVAIAPFDRRSPLVGAAAALVTFALARPRDVPWLPSRAECARWARALALPVAPVLLYGGYLLQRSLRPRPGGGGSLWGGYDGIGVVQMLLWPQFSYLARGFVAFATVLQFHWLLTALVVCAAAVVALRGRAAADAAIARGIDARGLAFVALLGALTLYLVSRPLVGPAPRYVLSFYPLLVALLGAALLVLTGRAALRHGGIGALVVLLAVSMFRTIDPVSRALWGTFSVGSLQMLHANSLGRSCCGYGRDQGVYNLEFTGFAALLDSALVRIRPVERARTLATSSDADWFAFGPLDARSRRTLYPDASPSARVVHPDTAGTGAVAGDTLWYLAPPYADHRAALHAALRHHTVLRVDTVWAAAFAMPVTILVGRAPGGG